MVLDVICNIQALLESDKYRQWNADSFRLNIR